MKEDDFKDLAIDDDESGGGIDSTIVSEKTGDQVPDDSAPEYTDKLGKSEEPSPMPAKLPIARNRSKKHFAFAVVVGLLIVLGTGFFIWKDQIVGYFVKQPDTTSREGSNTQTNENNVDPEVAKFIKPTTGETWLDTPKDMPAQGWLQVELLSNYSDVRVGTKDYKSAKQQLAEAAPTYKEVGARAGNTIVFVNSPSEGLAGVNYLFEKRTDGTIAMIVNPQADGVKGEDMSQTVTAKVTVLDKTTHYDSLNIPAKLPIGDDEFVMRPEHLWIADMWIMTGDAGKGLTTTSLSKYGGSTLYRNEVKYADTQLTNIGYYMELPLKTKVGLKYEPNQLSLQGYTFDNGASVENKVYYTSENKYDSLMPIARGCGGNSAAVTRSDSLKDADLTPVGKTNTGRTVYELKDKNSALYKKAYDEYKQAYGDNNAVSFDEYVKVHGLVIIKNSKNEMLVYVRSQYAMSGGCAKPVVYLYPTESTLVDVKVGANVTVSDPHYPTTGWRNVLAQPNGQLAYNGNTYDSLFWEGKGYGIYPGIVSGTVVKRADATATMRRQLGEQGLNTKETNDFMAFWESKIPNKPYIRLTWLDTAQMEALAPLTVLPKPQTVIRVFLDMDGYDGPLFLPAQQLKKVERKGFTVVEWGGLTPEIRH